MKATSLLAGLGLCLALAGCASPGGGSGGVFPCVWSDNGFALYPLYYQSATPQTHEETCWMLCGLTGWREHNGSVCSDWLVPLYARGRDWFWSLPYATFARGRRGRHELFLGGLCGWMTGDDERVEDHWAAPFYYKGRHGFATPVYGALGETEWILPLFCRTDTWSANLLYATKDDAKSGEHGLLMPWLLTWSAWNDKGGSSLYSPLWGRTGGGTAQTNAWWATPLVGTHAGLREGWWLFPLYDVRRDPLFAEKTRNVGAEFLPSGVDFPTEEVSDFRGRTSTNRVLRGSVATEDARTCLCLFDDDCTLEDRFVERDGRYECTVRRKIGNRLILGFERTMRLSYDSETRERRARREGWEFDFFWRVFRWADRGKDGTEVDFLFLPVWR